jgi:hypothetical protein
MIGRVDEVNDSAAGLLVVESCACDATIVSAGGWILYVRYVRKQLHRAGKLVTPTSIMLLATLGAVLGILHDSRTSHRRRSSEHVNAHFAAYQAHNRKERANTFSPLHTVNSFVAASNRHWNDARFL